MGRKPQVVRLKAPRLRKRKSSTTVPKAASARHGSRHAKLSSALHATGAKKSAGTSTKTHKSASKGSRHKKEKVPGPTAAQSQLGLEYEGEALAAQAEGYTSPYASQYGLIPETSHWNIAGPNPNAARMAKHHGKKNPAGASPARSTTAGHGHKGKKSPHAKKIPTPKKLDPASLMGHASTPGSNHLPWPQISVPVPHRTFQAK
jgi:hypothetical protein